MNNIKAVISQANAELNPEPPGTPAVDWLQKEIANKVVLWFATFEGLPTFDGKKGAPKVSRIRGSDYLTSVDLRGENLWVEFSYSCRGSPGEFDFLIPVRYLGAGGEDLLKAEAQQLREQLADKEVLRQQAAASKERLLYEKLHEKYSAINSVPD